MSDLQNNAEKHQYELLSSGQVIGKAEYQLIGQAVMFTHTEVNSSREGEGLGSQLVQFALEDVKAQGKQVIPLCPFVADYIKRHPDYLTLVHPEQRGALGL